MITPSGKRAGRERRPQSTADTASEWWVRLGATNRWRAFDNRLGGLTTGRTTITYTIQLLRTLNAICFFSLNAETVRLRVVAPDLAILEDRTIQMAARESGGNFWENVYNPITFNPDLVITDLLMPAGTTIELTIMAGSAAQVVEIMIGNDISIGETLFDSSLGIIDYSRKDRDEWGGIFIVPRPVTKTVNFRFSIPTEGASRVQRIMERVTSKVCVFYAVEGSDPFGTTVAGILHDYDLTLGAGRSYGTIQTEKPCIGSCFP